MPGALVAATMLLLNIPGTVRVLHPHTGLTRANVGAMTPRHWKRFDLVVAQNNHPWLLALSYDENIVDSNMEREHLKFLYEGGPRHAPYLIRG